MYFGNVPGAVCHGAWLERLVSEAKHPLASGAAGLAAAPLLSCIAVGVVIGFGAKKLTSWLWDK
jgi:hypothetical protein